MHECRRREESGKRLIHKKSMPPRGGSGHAFGVLRKGTLFNKHKFSNLFPVANFNFKHIVSGGLV
jgi:hypothetical protein